MRRPASACRIVMTQNKKTGGQKSFFYTPKESPTTHIVPLSHRVVRMQALRFLVPGEANPSRRGGKRGEIGPPKCSR